MSVRIVVGRDGVYVYARWRWLARLRWALVRRSLNGRSIPRAVAL